MLLLLFLYRSKSDLLYYAEYLPTISTQLKIISSVKAATPSDISVCWTLILDGSFLWMTGIEKTMNSSLSFCQAAVTFCLPGPLLARLSEWFTEKMTCSDPCPLGKSILKVTRPARKSACPGLPDGTFIEPCRWCHTINQSINQATLFKRVTLMSRKKAGYKKCTCKMAIICDRPFPNHL